MKDRCYNPNEKTYRRYGGRGISICEEWLNDPKKFEEWSLANGYADNLTIDRINVDLNYSPDNCRWVTMENNSRYKSTTSLIEVDGIVLTGREWAQKLNLGINVINKYIRQYGLENTREFIKLY